MEIQSGFGSSSREVIEAITDYARKLKKAKSAEFYMPPSILKEMYTFIDENDETMQALVAEIHIKAPEKSQISFSADVFYEMVDEIRGRSYRGLQVAEDEVNETAKKFMGKTDLPKVEYQKTIGEHVSRLRDRYRNATRVKFLDSVADLDIIVLAKELDAAVVSSDEGVIRWARKFGVKESVPRVLKKELDSLLLA